MQYPKETTFEILITGHKKQGKTCATWTSENVPTPFLHGLANPGNISSLWQRLNILIEMFIST